MVEDSSEVHLLNRCPSCGHFLAYAASGCPQCRVQFEETDPDVFWTCECERCARMVSAFSKTTTHKTPTGIVATTFTKLADELNERRDVGWLSCGTPRFSPEDTLEIEQRVQSILEEGANELRKSWVAYARSIILDMPQNEQERDLTRRIVAELKELT